MGFFKRTLGLLFTIEKKDPEQTADRNAGKNETVRLLYIVAIFVILSIVASIMKRCDAQSARMAGPDEARDTAAVAVTDTLPGTADSLITINQTTEQ